MMPHNEHTMRCSCGACIGPLLVQALDHKSTTRHTCVCLMVCQWIVRQGNQSAVLSAHHLSASGTICAIAMRFLSCLYSLCAVSSGLAAAEACPPGSALAASDPLDLTLLPLDAIAPCLPVSLLYRCFTEHPEIRRQDINRNGAGSSSVDELSCVKRRDGRYLLSFLAATLKLKLQLSVEAAPFGTPEWFACAVINPALRMYYVAKVRLHCTNQIDLLRGTSLGSISAVKWLQQ